MDIRHPIQVSPEPAVLSISFNESGTRLVCGLDNGLRMFRATDCVRTLKEAPEVSRGIAIAAALDDRYIALVGRGNQSNSTANKLQFWDNLEACMLATLDFAEPILAIRMTIKYLTVVLDSRTVYLQYVKDASSGHIRPGSVTAMHDTASNPYALCCIQNDMTILPGLTPGQVQIIWLNDKSKKIIKAHTSDLRQIELSKSGEIVATASRQGTLIRVFSTITLSQTHEFRRGVDAAIIYSLAISPRSNLIACSSDKGTLHIFDIRTNMSGANKDSARVQKRTSMSRVSSTARPTISAESDAFSLPSRSSSRPVSQAGGLHGLPGDISHTPPTNAPSALSALAKFPGMPKAFSDMRSMTSASYHLGSDPPNWQGQPQYTMTTLPSGQRAKVKNSNVPVPGLPDGRPPKGALCWDPDGGDRRLWCVGGGADARWEVFDLLEGHDGRLKLVKKGYRKYLGRQFPDNGR